MATPMRAKDTAAGSTLGRSSRSKMRDVLAPVARAATTNSRLAKDRVVARMTRKSRGADTKAKMIVSLNSVTGFQNVSITMMASRAGKARSTNETGVQHGVGRAAPVAGEEPGRAPHHQADEDGGEADDERDARPEDDAAPAGRGPGRRCRGGGGRWARCSRPSSPGSSGP